MYTIQSESSDGQIYYYWIPNMGDAYVVGTDGSIWSRYKRNGWHCFLSDDWTRMKSPPDEKGYPHLCLYFQRVRYEKRVHELVCEAVYGHCPTGMEVCHNDGIKSNNNWWNLRYDTPRGNEADKIIHGTAMVGEKAPSAKRTWEEVREIRAKWSSGKYTYQSLSLESGVCASSIYYIVNNLQWIEK